MFKRLINKRIIFSVLAIVIMQSACIGGRVYRAFNASPTSETAPTATEYQMQSITAPTERIELPTPTRTEIPATPSTTVKVTITAVKGNLFIRRGPDMAFNPIGVLYKDKSAEVIARDVLSQWLKIVIPNSKDTGWVSIQTKYSQVQGDLSSLPEITPTEWPVAAYLINCTYHDMYVMPGEITIPSYAFAPENEVWVYPGSYTIKDLDVPDYPEVMEVDIREGSNIEIQMNGLGEKRVCP